MKHVDVCQAIAERFLQLCKEKNTNPNKLAQWSGVPPSTLKSILYGTSKNPGAVTIKKLCDGLGISMAEFFDCELFYQLEQEIR